MQNSKLVLITGASSGIGQALALHYYRAGWRLALVARRGGEIERWAREQDLSPERLAVYAADVRDVASKTADNAARLAALFHTFTGSIGPIDLEAMEAAASVTAWPSVSAPSPGTCRTTARWWR